MVDYSDLVARQGMGASSDEDRAVVNGAGQAVSAVPASVPSADDFAGYITAVLGANPDYLQVALVAVSRGMSNALRHAERRAAQANQATLAAMALTSGRVGKDLRETLLARVTAAIHPQNQCGYERGYIDAHAQAIEARRAATTGAVGDESAVRQDAPNPDPLTNQDGGEKL